MQNKVAIVTGTNREIGMAMVKRLVALGYSVLAAHFGEAERVQVMVEQAVALGGTVELVDADLRSVAECQRVVALAVERFGRVDVLAANAGLTLSQPFLETDEATFDTLTSLNLKGTFFTAQAVAHQMLAQGREVGSVPYRIVVTSSVTGLRASPGSAVYAITKAGLRHMARTLSAELGQHGITVNAIAPGAILNERNTANQANYAEAWDNVVPLGRVGQPQDIANALGFLVSPEASWMTGQTLVVDGGWSGLGAYPK